MKEKHDNVVLKNYQNIKIVTLENKHVLTVSQIAATKIGIDPIISKINKVVFPITNPRSITPFMVEKSKPILLPEEKNTKSIQKKVSELIFLQ